MNKFDELLIQYLHGEISKADKVAFEKELETNTELQKELEELQNVDAFLEESLTVEFEDVLSADKQAQILKEAANKVKKPRTFWFYASRLAACFTIASVILASLVSGVGTALDRAYVPNSKARMRRKQAELRLAMLEESYASASYDLARPEISLKRLDKKLHIAKTEFQTEAYDHFVENDLINVSDEALSTFSIDVDTASYSNVRRFLNRGQMPPKGSIRIEELVNYFKYDYDTPKGEDPFAVNLAVSKCPWNDKAKLVRIGLKGQEIERSERPKANLVFLLDVSGSMSSQNKLPLLKKSMKLLLSNLNEQDKVAIVVYAGASGLVLPSTACSERGTIEAALERLSAGGATNGGAGIDLAYRTAIGNFIEDGINRVILCTDGDFNVGNTSHSGLIEQIQKNAKTGVFLSVLGFGMGNYKDSTLEKLANKGNGIYGYIDNYDEAKKLFVDQINGSLLTIAKDVKIQVEFNPQQVGSYRLVGYENRKLNKQDFNDDKKDAGEIGSGHTVTALYELIPAGAEASSKVDELKYQPKAQESDKFIGEIMNVKVRYKKPDEDKSKLLQFPLKGDLKAVDKVNEEMKMVTSVATFGMILRDSKYKGTADYDKVLELAKGLTRADEKEFIELVKKAKRLSIMNK